MKTLTLLAIIILTPIYALANTYLVCDPQEDVAKYEIEINGSVSGQFTPEPDGSARYDITNFSNGHYVFRLRCSDSKGWWTEWSDPFDATRLDKVGNVRISSE